MTWGGKTSTEFPETSLRKKNKGGKREERGAYWGKKNFNPARGEKREAKKPWGTVTRTRPEGHGEKRKREGGL